jgi:hypothetical protein
MSKKKLTKIQKEKKIMANVKVVFDALHFLLGVHKQFSADPSHAAKAAELQAAVKEVAADYEKLSAPDPTTGESPLTVAQEVVADVKASLPKSAAYTAPAPAEKK